jgi:MFS family permease
MTTAALQRPWLVLAGLALGVTVTNGFARFAYGLLLPAMKSEMGWTYAQAGWLNTANALGYIGGALLTMLLIRRVPPTRLFAFGVVTTTLALLATGLNPALGWQTGWRIAAGVLGAMSFSTAGTLAAGLFQGDTRRNALAIAILFGTGGGLGIVLAGAVLPLMLQARGAASWPLGWVLIGGASLCCVPLSLWAALQLRTPAQGSQATDHTPLPLRRMLPEMAGYAGFGLGYIVYLTFLSAWMTEQRASAGFIALVWVVLGTSICLSPFVWRRVLARHASGLPLAHDPHLHRHRVGAAGGAAQRAGAAGVGGGLRPVGLHGPGGGDQLRPAEPAAGGLGPRHQPVHPGVCRGPDRRAVWRRAGGGPVGQHRRQPAGGCGTAAGRRGAGPAAAPAEAACATGPLTGR